MTNALPAEVEIARCVRAYKGIYDIRVPRRKDLRLR